MKYSDSGVRRCMHRCVCEGYRIRGLGGILPQGKFEFLGYIRWYLGPFYTIQG